MYLWGTDALDLYCQHPAQVRDGGVAQQRAGESKLAPASISGKPYEWDHTPADS